MKITLGYIDKDSKKFKTFMKVSSMLGAVGGILAFDSVTMPFVEIIWKNNRSLRNLARLGAINLSWLAGIASGAAVEFNISNAVDLYNHYVSGLPYSGPKQEETDIPEETENEEMVDENLLDYRYAFFGDDADAKAKSVVEYLEAMIEENGFATVNDLRSLQHRNTLDDGDTLGWTKDDVYDFSIEQVMSSNEQVGAILMLKLPHDISDKYVTIKPVVEGKDKEKE